MKRYEYVATWDDGTETPLEVFYFVDNHLDAVRAIRWCNDYESLKRLGCEYKGFRRTGKIIYLGLFEKQLRNIKAYLLKRRRYSSSLTTTASSQRTV